ncbi:hypothetical protein Hanom_Chr03g00258361 [Helianthus anomalus]
MKTISSYKNNENRSPPITFCNKRVVWSFTLNVKSHTLSSLYLTLSLPFKYHTLSSPSSLPLNTPPPSFHPTPPPPPPFLPFKSQSSLSFVFLFNLSLHPRSSDHRCELRPFTRR